MTAAVDFMTSIVVCEGQRECWKCQKGVNERKGT